jgi:hypothetical protein
LETGSVVIQTSVFCIETFVVCAKVGEGREIVTIY